MPIILSKVVFPDPDTPSIATNSLTLIFRLRLSIAVTLSAPLILYILFNSYITSAVACFNYCIKYCHFQSILVITVFIQINQLADQSNCAVALILRIETDYEITEFSGIIPFISFKMSNLFSSIHLLTNCL